MRICWEKVEGRQFRVTGFEFRVNPKPETLNSRLFYATRSRGRRANQFSPPVTLASLSISPRLQA